MLESLQGTGVPRLFVISRQSGNVTLVPSWTNQLTPVLVCASAVDSRPSMILKLLTYGIDIINGVKILVYRDKIGLDRHITVLGQLSSMWIRAVHRYTTKLVDAHTHTHGKCNYCVLIIIKFSNFEINRRRTLLILGAKADFMSVKRLVSF